jgi:nucleoside-diphosphate-sugar epimerase
MWHQQLDTITKDHIMTKNSCIILVGATGDLGGRIATELRQKDAQVRALVRSGTSQTKRQKLESLGCVVQEVNFSDSKALSDACLGGSIVISTLAGLRKTMVETQIQLLNAAVAAKVPRFIPSDFALDFTKLPSDWNRNLSFRNEFRAYADKANIKVTSILNGGFMNMLTGVAPFILFKINRVLCWGNPDQMTDWTTIEDTAKFTALAALDPETPRYLKIAGDQISANMLAHTMSELTGKKFKVLRPGNLNLFKFIIGLTKLMSKETNELYPPWQGMQYMHNMYSGVAKFDKIDNDRYKMKWTTTKELIGNFLRDKHS